MRIISGSARGRKLHRPADNKTIRPTTDRAREALFSIIGSRVRQSRVLDLFAGTGAIGCESLSRGAASVSFIENDRTALKLIKKNIQLIPDASEKSKIIKYDLRRGLPPLQISGEPLRHFDLIFADPPYQKGYSERMLTILDSSSILSDHVLVIIEEKKTVELPQHTTHLKLIDVRRYGDSVFSFYTRDKR